jgi:hypothetical protein
MDMCPISSRMVAGYARSIMLSAALLFFCGSAGAFPLDFAQTGPVEFPEAPIPARSDSVSPAADSAAVDTMMSVWSIDELNEVLTAESTVGGEPGRGGAKNSQIAVLSALVFPGLGQVYNERPLKAAIAFGVEMFYYSQIYFEYRNAERERLERDRFEPGSPEWNEHDIWMNEYDERMIDWVWWSAFAILIVTLDAYVDAHLHDMNFQIESRALDRGAGLELVFDF